MPGSSLAYGQTDWSSKAMALVWAVYLMVGASLASLYHWYHHVRSITTDYGVEISIGVLCDVLPGFVKWLGGMALDQAGAYVDHSRRLMPKCLKIGGWCHTFGTIMKEACQYFPQVP